MDYTISHLINEIIEGKDFVLPLEKLSKFGSSAFEPVAALLEDADVDLKQEIAATLLEIDEAKAKRFLRPHVYGRDSVFSSFLKEHVFVNSIPVDNKRFEELSVMF
jgi:hypothetical protein